MVRSLTNIFALLVLLAEIRCTALGPEPPGTGPTSGIGVSVRTINGIPAAGAFVRIRPASFLKTGSPSKKDCRDTVTDSKGNVFIGDLRLGNYFLEATDNESTAVLIKFILEQPADSVFLGEYRMKPFATITGALDSTGSSSDRFHVHLRGLERIAEISPDKGFSFADLPEGSFDLQIDGDDTATSPIDISNVKVSSGDAFSILVPTGFSHARFLYIDTRTSGAGIMSEINDFPLLVRLNAANFDFGEGNASGSDIRFMKADGTPIPYEVERWDRAGCRAEIWARIDTVYGNNSSQHFMMYWGSSTAAEASSSAMVFPESSGFLGVWHLGQNSDNMATDATSNHYNGTTVAMASDAAVEGIIGKALKFNGVTDYIRMTGTADSPLNFVENDRYTISAWVHTDALRYTPLPNADLSIRQTVISKGELQYGLGIDATGRWNFGEFCTAQGYEQVTTDSVAAVKTWQSVTAVRNGASMKLYLDGKLVDDSPFWAANSSARETGNDVMIGKAADLDDCYFGGLIDEVRISSTPATADWVRLCYMNQKPGATVVSFR